MKQLIVEEISTMIEETIENIFFEEYHKAQRSLRIVVCNVFEQAMLDILRKDVIGNTLDVHSAKFFDIEITAKKLSEKLLTSSLL